ncbi:MAG: hypothetical protein KAS39_02420 [Actinomycetia bacterium]|nr:hypothetical protein [Actinomycetes bacterium]
MPLKFKEEEINYTFIWDEGGPEECSFTLRQPSPRDVTRIMEQNTSFEWDAPTNMNKRKREQFQKRYEKVNHEAFMDDKVDFLIIGWDVQDPEGKPWPCIRENKISLDKGRPDITGWLMDKLDEQADAKEEAGDQEEKN